MTGVETCAPLLLFCAPEGRRAAGPLRSSGPQAAPLMTRCWSCAPSRRRTPGSRLVGSGGSECRVLRPRHDARPGVVPEGGDGDDEEAEDGAEGSDASRLAVQLTYADPIRRGGGVVRGAGA